MIFPERILFDDPIQQLKYITILSNCYFDPIVKLNVVLIYFAKTQMWKNFTKIYLKRHGICQRDIKFVNLTTDIIIKDAVYSSKAEFNDLGVTLYAMLTGILPLSKRIHKIPQNDGIFIFNKK